MTDPELQSAASDPRPRFQFTLQTLLLLFVVLASSLAVFGAWGIVVFGLVLGLAVCLHSRRSLWLPLFLFLGAFFIGLWRLSLTSEHPPEALAMCISQMDRIAWALMEYDAANGSFPPAYVADRDGKPMHSWRVLSCRTWGTTISIKLTTSASLGTRERI